MKYKFVEVIHGWAEGPSQPEYYIVHEDSFVDGELDEEYFIALGDQYCYSDRYRGLTHRVLDRPPKEWLKGRIRSLEQTIKSNQEVVAELKVALATYEWEEENENGS